MQPFHFLVFTGFSGVQITHFLFFWGACRSPRTSISEADACTTGVGLPQERCKARWIYVCCMGWSLCSHGLAWAPLPKAPRVQYAHSCPISRLQRGGYHPPPLQNQTYFLFIVMTHLNHLLLILINSGLPKEQTDYRYCHGELGL